MFSFIRELVGKMHQFEIKGHLSKPAILYNHTFILLLAEDKGY